MSHRNHGHTPLHGKDWKKPVHEKTGISQTAINTAEVERVYSAALFFVRSAHLGHERCRIFDLSATESKYAPKQILALALQRTGVRELLMSARVVVGKDTLATLANRDDPDPAAPDTSDVLEPLEPQTPLDDLAGLDAQKDWARREILNTGSIEPLAPGALKDVTTLEGSPEVQHTTPNVKDLDLLVAPSRAIPDEPSVVRRPAPQVLGVAGIPPNV